MAKVECAALPEGTTYCEAKVKFSINGGRLIYTFKQGEGGQQPVVGDVDGNGRVDIADVNAVINMMLGRAEATEAGDVTGGGIDIADVNAIINIMLGK